MNWKFGVEKFKDIFEEMRPMLAAHYEEIIDQPGINLDPDTDRYELLESNGGLLCFTAREGAELIGYALFFIAHSLQSKRSLQALQDCIYIQPRKRGFGKLFIARCDHFLREIGVQIVYHHVPVKTDWQSALLIQDYKPVDMIYAKRLDKQRE